MSSLSKGWILTLVILLITVAQFSGDIYLPSVPSMVAALNTSGAHVQFSLVIATIASGFSQLFYGPLSDHYGRRISILTGLMIFVLGSLVCNYVNTIEMLWLGRVIQGIGLGCVGPVASAIPRDIYTGKALVKAYSFYSMALSVAPIVAPVIGGYLQEGFGWRANFTLLLAYGLLMSLVLFTWLPETNPNVRQNRFSIISVLKNYLAILRNHTFMVFLISDVLIFAAEMSYIISSPLIYQNLLGFTPVQNGWLVLFTAGGLFLGGFTNSRLINFFHSQNIIVAGLVVQVLASLLMLAFALLGILNIYVVLLPMMLAMFGLGLTFPNCIAIAIELFPEKAGTAGAVFGALLLAGGSLLSLIIVRLPETSVLPLSSFMSCLTGLSLLLVVFYVIKYKPAA
jgi:DHA1 family 2-module integral membrane pump EmrD-like MFS transporter